MIAWTGIGSDGYNRLADWRYMTAFRKSPSLALIMTSMVYSLNHVYHTSSGQFTPSDPAIEINRVRIATVSSGLNRNLAHLEVRGSMIRDT